MQTDSMIQRTLRTAPVFRDCTIIVIAHRIQTVIDADIVVVLSGGGVIEMGSPKELGSQPDSAFSSMVREHSSGSHING